MATTQTFGAATALGTYTGWNVTGSENPNTGSERVVARDANGNEAASGVHGARTDYSATYECDNDTNTPPATAGALVGSTAILTGINFSTSNRGPATMALTAHNHAANAHTDTLLQAAHGIAVSKWFGAVDFLGGTGGEGATVLSGTCNIEVGHNDVNDADGDHAAGQNAGCTITATTVWQGTVTTPADTGWDVTQNDVATSSTGVKTTTVTASKGLTLAAPA
jgi:hypothetical protein